MDNYLLTMAIVAFSIQTFSVAGAAYLANMNATRAQNAAIKAHEATEDAKRAAVAAAQAIVDSVKVTDARDQTLYHIAEVGDSTHRIVNSERTRMRRFIAVLARKVASDNPNDPDAQKVADEAEAAVEDAAEAEIIAKKRADASI